MLFFCITKKALSLSRTKIHITYTSLLSTLLYFVLFFMFSYAHVNNNNNIIFEGVQQPSGNHPTRARCSASGHNQGTHPELSYAIDHASHEALEHAELQQQHFKEVCICHFPIGFYNEKSLTFHFRKPPSRSSSSHRWHHAPLSKIKNAHLITAHLLPCPHT